VDIDVLTDQFSAITVNLDDASSNVDIQLPGIDVIDINGAAATSTLNNLVLSNTAPSFTFSLDEASTNIAINNVDLGSGAFSATATAGNVTVVGAGGGIVATGTAAITLVADGGGTLTVNDALTSTGGAITLRADDDVVFGANGDVTTNGNVIVKADFDDQANGTGGAITMNDGTMINAGTGTITMNADENITLGGLSSTNATSTAVTLGSTSGGIVDGGDTFVDINAANGGASITTVTGVGSAGAIETTLSSISATASGAGNIQIVETNGITLTNLTTANGSITVTAAGAVTATNVNASGTGQDVSLTTTVNGMTLTNVLADDDITVSAPGDLTLGVIGDSGTDDISLTTTGGVMTDANAGTLNITGDALTLNSFGDIGSASDPIEINVNTFVYNLTQGGAAAYLSASGSSTILDLTLSSGNIVFGSTGDLFVRTANAVQGTVTLTAGGSIYAADDNSLVSAYGDIRLTAGNVIGTINRPLRVHTTAGHIYISTGGKVDNVSASLIGDGPRPIVTFTNEAPGLGLYNGQIMGGEAVNDLFPEMNIIHTMLPSYSGFERPLYESPALLDGFIESTDYLNYTTL
jgi:hypothetical protein